MTTNLQRHIFFKGVLTNLSTFHVQMFAVMLVFNLVSKIQLGWITSRCTQFYVQQTITCRSFYFL